MRSQRSFEESLNAVLQSRIDGCRGLVSAERLSGGASQETYRLVIRTDAGERKLAMRRAPLPVGVEDRLVRLDHDRPESLRAPEVMRTVHGYALTPLGAFCFMKPNR